jgi:hypothetical protein
VLTCAQCCRFPLIWRKITAFYKWKMIAAVSRHPEPKLLSLRAGEPVQGMASLCVGHVTRFDGLTVRPLYRH